MRLLIFIARPLLWRIIASLRGLSIQSTEYAKTHPGEISVKEYQDGKAIGYARSAEMIKEIIRQGRV